MVASSRIKDWAIPGMFFATRATWACQGTARQPALDGADKTCKRAILCCHDQPTRLFAACHDGVKSSGTKYQVDHFRVHALLGQTSGSIELSMDRSPPRHDGDIRPNRMAALLNGTHVRRDARDLLRISPFEAWKSRPPPGSPAGPSVWRCLPGSGPAPAPPFRRVFSIERIEAGRRHQNHEPGNRAKYPSMSSVVHASPNGSTGYAMVRKFTAPLVTSTGSHVDEPGKR